MKKILIPLFSVAALASFQTANAADEAAATALFNSKGCIACHSIENKMVGPSYKEVAANRTEADVAEIAAHIKNGSQGVYGPIPMPPSGVTEEEAKILAEWVITLK